MLIDLVAAAGLALIAFAFVFTMFELKIARRELELTKQLHNHEYKRGFADGYDVAHEERSAKMSAGRDEN